MHSVFLILCLAVVLNNNYARSTAAAVTPTTPLVDTDDNRSELQDQDSWRWQWPWPQPWSDDIDRAPVWGEVNGE